MYQIVWAGIMIVYQKRMDIDLKYDMNDTGSRFYYVVDKSGKQLFEPKKIDG